MEQGEESSIHFQEFFRSLPTGCNTNDGKIEPCKAAGTIYGGLPPYSYQWSNGAETCNIFNLINGIYTLTVTDALGCFSVKSTELLTDDALTIEYEETKRPCINSSNGEININTNKSAQFEWSVTGAQSSENNSLLHNVGPGTYCVTISDIMPGSPSNQS